jgi:hypothetical protein
MTEPKRTIVVTIAARESWVELVPVGGVYYRLAGGGRVLSAGAYVATLDHDAKTFTIEEKADA